MMRYLSCIVLVVGVLFLAGCGGQAKRVYAPSMNASAVAKAAIAEFGSDGKINAEQLKKVPSLAVLADNEGNVTEAAIKDRIEAWQKTRLGRVMWSCGVLHNGKPLGNAKVKFVPEKFLGTGFPGAEGTTGPEGSTSIRIPNLDPPGLALGFYRVEITKEGESIPAKFNTETTLGQAIESGSIGLGNTYDLKY